MLRRRAFLIMGSVTLAMAGLRLGLAQHLPVICPLRRLTGIPCASCGLTRAAVAISHGQLAAASTCNFAAVPLALALVLALLLLAWEAATQRPVIGPIWSRCAGGLTWFAVALLLAAWVGNLHHQEP